ncbi:cobyrinate a,c-diamide synthase, partial [Allocoleopsis sp.]|uniref:cobyrinate a,c-diamide synthase n=1 Tax=Allocoleopsis sp. TaxID=3088169 RepID=UPI002FD31BAA
MALVIAGERSGVGKTTVTLALLSLLSRHKQRVQSFKVGPDYIDPMFHQQVTGRPCRNLDPVLTSENYVQDCFTRHVQGMDYALVEGVMGLFDGATGRHDWASTAHVARLLELPVLLVLDCSRLSRSVAAIAHGYRSFDPRIQLAGVVLNRVGSDRHLELLKDALEPLQIPVLGVLRRQDNITIPARHLGLIPTAEMVQLDDLIDRLAHLAESCFDWERLFPLLTPLTPLVKGGTGFKVPLNKGDLGGSPGLATHSKLYFPTPPSDLAPPAPQLWGEPELQSPPELGDLGGKKDLCINRSLIERGISLGNLGGFPVRLAIARDRAFSFYYQDNLDILQELGAELVPWSPLTDTALPA